MPHLPIHSTNPSLPISNSHLAIAINKSLRRSLTYPKPLHVSLSHPAIAIRALPAVAVWNLLQPRPLRVQPSSRLSNVKPSNLYSFMPFACSFTASVPVPSTNLLEKTLLAFLIPLHRRFTPPRLGPFRCLVRQMNEPHSRFLVHTFVRHSTTAPHLSPWHDCALRFRLEKRDGDLENRARSVPARLSRPS